MVDPADSLCVTYYALNAPSRLSLGRKQERTVYVALYRCYGCEQMLTFQAAVRNLSSSTVAGDGHDRILVVAKVLCTREVQG